MYGKLRYAEKSYLRNITAKIRSQKGGGAYVIQKCMKK